MKTGNTFAQTLSRVEARNAQRLVQKLALARMLARLTNRHGFYLLRAAERAVLQQLFRSGRSFTLARTELKGGF